MTSTTSTIKWGTTKKERTAKRLTKVYEEQRALEAEENRLKDAETELAAALDEGYEDAGRTRSDAVHELYERFGIEEVTTERKKRGGGVVHVRTDKEEVKRSQLLLETIEKAMAELEVRRAGGDPDVPVKEASAEPGESAEVVTQGDDDTGGAEGEEASDGDEGTSEVTPEDAEDGTEGADGDDDEGDRSETVEDRDEQGWAPGVGIAYGS